MHKELVEWETSFQDKWDGQGHYTVDGEELPITVCLADILSVCGHAVLDIWPEYSEEDNDLMVGVFLTGFTLHAEACGVPVDFIFDNDEELFTSTSDLIDVTYTINRKCTLAYLMESTCEGWFGE
jgi:hypothetical protein